MLFSSRADRRPAREPARTELVESSNLSATCFRLNSITLSRSQTLWQTWFPTCRRQVRAEPGRRLLRFRPAFDRPATRTRHAHAGMSATWIRPNSIMLSSSRAGCRSARELAHQLASAMEVGLKIAIIRTFS